MRKLHLTFLNEDGSKKTLIIHCVHQELTPEQVKTAMEEIVELELFEKDGLRLMTGVHSAKYVEIIETPLFDNDNKMALAVPSPPVEDNEPNYQETTDDELAEKVEEKQEDAKDEFFQEERTPKKQLAKIYPFVPREEWERRKAATRKNRSKSLSKRPESYVKQQADSAEFIVPLFALEQGKTHVHQVECRNRGRPEYCISAAY